MAGYREGYVPFTAAVKAMALRRAGGACEQCHTYVGHRLEVDHHVPQAEGGTGSLSNAVCLCHSCHRAKTMAEQARGMQRRSRTRAQHTRMIEQHPNQPRHHSAGTTMPDGRQSHDS